ncbi:IclR family transcriptional regulator [Aeromicrobium sp. CF4.19]|uniref:IclR family transcriptional regulator n=1 Tax=Aeromicrobium sp. CF4.19 TaxID=3373082 RepID=UPI003EE51115
MDRALQLLTTFDSAHPQWRARDLSRQLGWDKSVTHRILTTLTRRGFLLVDSRTHAYRLGPAVYHLGQLAARDNPMVPMVRPTLHELAMRCGETVLFTVPDGDEAHCVAAVEGPSPIRYSTRAGSRVPGHTGAGAKVLFAWRSEREQRRLFGGRTLARYTDHTITDLDLLVAEFARVRDAGVAVSVGEMDPDVGAVSVPVWAGHTTVVAALSAVGPLARVQRETTQLKEALASAATEVSDRLTEHDAVTA